MSDKFKYDQDLVDLLVKTGDTDERKAIAAQYEFAQAVQEPIRDALLYEDTLDGVFEVENLAPGASARYELSVINPGEEADFIAYTVPSHGLIPQRQIEADYIYVPTYRVANSIDWTLQSAREARMSVAEKGLAVMTAGVKKKLCDDAWHTVLAAGVDRNIVVSDADASAGQFTKRLLSLMSVAMTRNAGGNAASLNKAQLTDIWTSLENIEDIRNWNVDQIDEITRREFLLMPTGNMFRLLGINIHQMNELGENQEYQTFYTGTLGASLGSDVELVIGLDLSKNDCFVMPVRQALAVHADTSLFRAGKTGYWCDLEPGFAALDNRRSILGTC